MKYIFIFLIATLLAGRTTAQVPAPTPVQAPPVKTAPAGHIAAAKKVSTAGGSTANGTAGTGGSASGAKVKLVSDSAAPKPSAKQ